MKLRILDDALRLRLSRPEVAEFAATGCVEATTGLARTPLTYRLVAGRGFAADLADGVLTVTVPADDVTDWANGDAPVGLYGDAGVRIAVEKDFHCLIPRDGIDPDDFYPNPKTPRA